MSGRGRLANSAGLNESREGGHELSDGSGAGNAMAIGESMG